MSSGNFETPDPKAINAEIKRLESRLKMLKQMLRAVEKYSDTGGSKACTEAYQDSLRNLPPRDESEYDEAT